MIRSDQSTQKLDNILNNTPVTAPTQRESPAPELRQVTFSESNKTTPSPRVNNSTQRTTAAQITKATIDKPITNIPTARVH
jgi:hypothetical protein